MRMGRRRGGSRSVAVAGAGLGLAGRELVRRQREADLTGQVALITGSSRGLGFLLARELVREGCRVVICARNAEQLERARRELDGGGADVLAVPCDITDREQVQDLVRRVVARFGPVDILVNNAGVIQVGPLQAMTLADFEEAMATMYWGVVYPTLTVLPEMRARHQGRIANITSIGGRISVPHLLPYNAAKFAAVGFSEGLRAELAGEGIAVTTIVPGLMRTGSAENAYFKGQHTAEATLFTLMASLPGFSMDAERAASQIVRAIKRGDASVTLSLTALAAERFHGLFPGVTAQLLGLANRLLPKGANQERRRGIEVREEIRMPAFDALTAWGRSAARRFNEVSPETGDPSVGDESRGQAPKSAGDGSHGQAA
jgi:NAD(P)-dependent dehydrogenase (short-subunit alcohol dehydrogenase family)